MPELSKSGGDGAVRPGAMTAVMNATREPSSGPRWLRWALVRDGRIEREEVRSPDAPLTAGSMGDVPRASTDGARELLLPRDGTWVLRVDGSLSGRTQHGTIEELAADAPRGPGGAAEITLARDARVRLDLGDGARLLVQLVDRPPIKAKPALPASVRGGLLVGADWWFTSFVACSFMLHFGLVTFLMQADWPIERSLIPEEHIAEVIWPDTEPPDDSVVPETPMDPDAEETTDDGEEVADNSEDTPPRPAPVHRPSPVPGDAERTQESLDEQAIAEANLAVQEVLGALGDSMGEVTNRLAEGADLSNSASIMEVAEGTRVDGEEAPGRMAMRHGGDPEPCREGEDCLGRLARRNGGHIRQPEEVVEIEVHEPTVRPPGIDDIVDVPPVGWSSRELYRALRGRMGQIRACYEHELTRGNPDMAGRLTVTMTVRPVGTVSDVRVSENTTGSPAIAQCAIRAVSRVRIRQGPPEPVPARFPVVLVRNQ